MSNEAGVAMVTVLFVGAVLTVVSSTAFFISLQDFQAGADERRAAGALAYAEAGIDRFMLEIRGARWSWGELMQSGCGGAPVLTISGTIGNGTYNAQVRPQVCLPATILPNALEARKVIITSTGTHPTARRVVEQIASVKPKALPIGIFANRGISFSGSGQGGSTERIKVTNASLVTPGNIDRRDFAAFAGMDPYYGRGHFYPDTWSLEAPGNMPAAAHAGGSISCQTRDACAGDNTEHVGVDFPLNCTANEKIEPWRAAWDGSFNGGPVGTRSCAGSTVGVPPTTKFDWNDPTLRQRLGPERLTDEDLAALKQLAQTRGLYCNYAADGNGTCQYAGAPPVARNIGTAHDSNELITRGLPNNFVAYYDLAGNDPKSSFNTIKWNAGWSYCDEANPAATKTVTMIVPNGSVDFGGSGVVTGAVIADRGIVKTGGGATIHGTIIADELDIRGGSNFRLDDCWMKNMPFAYLDLTPLQWREIDR